MNNILQPNELDKNTLSMLENLSTEFSGIEGSCYFAHITTGIAGPIGRLVDEQHKVNGSVLIVIVKGHMQVSLNIDVFEVDGPALVSLHHGQMVRISPNENQQVDAYALIYSPSFLHDINISFSSISPEALIGNYSPVIILRDRELTQILRFYNMIHTVMTDTFNAQLNRHIISSLTSAMFYQFMLYMYKRIETTTDAQNGPRRSNYVHDFMRLLHVYYTRERSVNFYASQLFISPKYLSLLVKEATGRSAARWIDNFVITEAKNLLRFSGKNVQQVAYALNFSNQSSFGKYFKHLTGMSPTEYQKQ